MIAYILLINYISTEKTKKDTNLQSFIRIFFAKSNISNPTTNPEETEQSQNLDHSYYQQQPESTYSFSFSFHVKKTLK